MAVTEEIIKNHKQGTRKRYSDVQGLYLDINSSGKATWILRKMVRGERESTVIGYWPEMSIPQARAAARAESIKISSAKAYAAPASDKPNADPAILKADAAVPAAKKVRRAEKNRKTRSFADIYYEYMDIKMHPLLSKTYCESVHSRALTYLLPSIGEMELEDITSPLILETVRRVEKLGRLDTAKRVLGLAYAVFNYAKACRYFAGQNPAADMSDALMARPVKHMAFINSQSDIGKLLYAASNYSSFFLRHAIKIQAHTFVRSSELRFAQWNEINLQKKEWKIPAERMKMPAAHIVPLSTHVVEEFMFLKSVTGDTKYVFRSTKRPFNDEPFSEAAVLVALKACLTTIGLPENAMVGHGWRSFASTVLNESSHFRPDAIERQLAHMERDSVRASYNYAQYLPERQKMMQWYSDFLDKLERYERDRSTVARDRLFYQFSDRKKEDM